MYLHLLLLLIKYFSFKTLYLHDNNDSTLQVFKDGRGDEKTGIESHGNVDEDFDPVNDEFFEQNESILSIGDLLAQEEPSLPLVDELTEAETEDEDTEVEHEVGTETEEEEDSSINFINSQDDHGVEAMDTTPPEPAPNFTTYRSPRRPSIDSTLDDDSNSGLDFNRFSSALPLTSTPLKPGPSSTSSQPRRSRTSAEEGIEGLDLSESNSTLDDEVFLVPANEPKKQKRQGHYQSHASSASTESNTSAPSMQLSGASDPRRSKRHSSSSHDLNLQLSMDQTAEIPPPSPQPSQPVRKTATKSKVVRPSPAPLPRTRGNIDFVADAVRRWPWLVRFENPSKLTLQVFFATSFIVFKCEPCLNNFHLLSGNMCWYNQPMCGMMWLLKITHHSFPMPKGRQNNYTFEDFLKS